MSNIIIPNSQDFNEKLQKIIAWWPEKFHVIADFDRTLTKAFVDGKPTLRHSRPDRESIYSQLDSRFRGNDVEQWMGMTWNSGWEWRGTVDGNDVYTKRQEEVVLKHPN